MSVLAEHVRDADARFGISDGGFALTDQQYGVRHLCTAKRPAHRTDKGFGKDAQEEAEHPRDQQDEAGNVIRTEDEEQRENQKKADGFIDKNQPQPFAEGAMRPKECMKQGTTDDIMERGVNAEKIS